LYAWAGSAGASEGTGDGPGGGDACHEAQIPARVFSALSKAGGWTADRTGSGRELRPRSAFLGTKRTTPGPKFRGRLRARPPSKEATGARTRHSRRARPRISYVRPYVKSEEIFLATVAVTLLIYSMTTRLLTPFTRGRHCRWPESNGMLVSRWAINSGATLKSDPARRKGPASFSAHGSGLGTS
jgi:hypothetical protein